MIEQYKIIEKATDLLSCNPLFEGVTIEQSVALNENVDRTPWIGVYPDVETFVPKYIGGIDNWEREITIRVYVQVASGREGTDLERLITEHIKNVIATVYADNEAWYGLLDRINEVRVEHGFREDDQGTMLFRESTVIFIGTVSSGVQ